jgi:chemotaxis protein methyltransferase CheR
LLEQAKAEPLDEFWEKTAFQRIKTMLHEKAGLDCSGYRDEYLRRRFEIRLRATGANSYGKYLIYLRKNPDELNNLLNDLTINFTMFFRDMDVYNYLEHVLLPKLFQTSHNIKIWSAGCATGEEPYSLAILVHKVLKHRIHNYWVTIIASDIDRDALAKAGKGEFHEKQLSNLDSSTLNEFFTKNQDNYLIKANLKKLIHFEQVDLMTPSLHTNVDLILCRNVMIYFSRESQQKIHMNFYNSLRNGGYLITGKSEILTGEPATKFISVDNLARVYQKGSELKNKQ